MTFPRRHARRCRRVRDLESIPFHRQPAEPRRLLVVRSREVPVAGIARTERVGPGPGSARWPRVQASLGIDRRENPPRPAITSQLTAPTRRPILFGPHHVFTPSHPSVGTARKEEGENPRAFNQIGTRPPGRWGDARRARGPAPQSKPVAHASRLVTQNAPSVAFGLGVRIPAAGPAHSRLYSPFGVYAREPQNKSARTSPAGIGGLPATRQARLPPTTPAPQSFSQTATRADRNRERQQGQAIGVDRAALPAPGRPHRRSPVRGATVTTLLLL